MITDSACKRDYAKRVGDGLELTPTERFTYVMVAWYAAPTGALHIRVDGAHHPDHPTLVELTGYSRRALLAALKKLEQVGLIGVEKRRTKGGRQAGSRITLAIAQGAPAAPEVVQGNPGAPCQGARGAPLSDSDDAEMASDQGVCVSRGTSKDSTKKEPRRKRELRSLEQSSSSEQGAKKATRGQYQQRDHLARLFSISANTTEWHTLLGTLKACEFEYGIAPERAGEIMRKVGKYLPKDQVLAHEQEIQRAHQQRERQAAEQERLRYGHLLDEIEIARGMASAEPSHPLIRMKVMRGVSEADAVADMRSIGEQRLAAAQQQLAECGLTVEAPVAA